MANTYIELDPENLRGFEELPRDEPFQMLNLLRFREWAQYPDGHEHVQRGWTGREAYEEYSRAIASTFVASGAEVVWQASFQSTVVGAENETWDAMIVVEYPNADAFLAMISDPKHHAGSINRTAALADWRLYRATPVA